MLFVCYPKCTTSQKAKKWLDDRGIACDLRGIKLVKNGGYLATCSCSHFMTPELFTKTIGEAARDARRRLRQVEYRTQSPDHPILWGADQSYYLKFYIFQVVDEL